MQILVTGGAGFIGSHIVRALAERGDAVRVLDDFSTGRRANLEAVEAEIIEADIRDLDAVRQAMAGVTHVIHLAALASVPRSVADPLASNAVNVTGTLNVLVAARDAGARRVLFASSSSIYGEAGAGAGPDADGVAPKREDLPLNPLSPYGVAKLAAEKYCAAFHTVYGLETVALRYFNVFGPRQDPRSEYAAVIPRFISALLAGRRPVIYGDGEQTRDFTYVANVVRGNLLALEAEGVAGLALNLATGGRVSLNELARALAQAAGQPAAPEYAAPRVGDIRHSSADIRLARERLDYSPVVSFEDGLALTLRWFQENASWK